MRFTINVETRIPDVLIEQATGHANGSVHASSMFNGDRDGEVRGWFEDELVNPLGWDFVHPFMDDLPGPDDPRTFTEAIQNEIKHRGLLVWDIQRNHYSTGYLNICDGDGRRIRLSGRADFIITEPEPDIEFLLKTRIVIEIQSRPEDDLCELQLQVYLLLLMNTKGLRYLFGILIYTDGRCRIYRATRDEHGGCVYEGNGIFYVFCLPDVIQHLLNGNV